MDHEFSPCSWEEIRHFRLEGRAFMGQWTHLLPQKGRVPIEESREKAEEKPDYTKPEFCAVGMDLVHF